MNFIVGNLLKYLSEEEAFWAFVQAAEALLPIDYYCGMLGILIDQKVFELLLEEKLPVLVAHMRANSYHLDMMAVEWFVTLFQNVLSQDAEQFVLTAFFLKG